MAKPTYFLTNCTTAWVFHRLQNLHPFNVLYESLHSIFYAPLLFFLCNQILWVWNCLNVSILTTYFHKIFTMKTVFSALSYCAIFQSKNFLSLP